MNYALQESKRTMHLSARFWGSKRTFLWCAETDDFRHSWTDWFPNLHSDQGWQYQHKQYQQINPTQFHPNYTADIREGVAIEYVSCEPSDSLKELFSEGYNADDDSFEEAKPEQV